jgi:hypothetical protein
MMISCDKAATICDKAQYKEATFFEKLKLNVHVLICKACAKHTKRNTKFTSLCNKANLNSLSEQEKLEIKQKLKGRV